MYIKQFSNLALFVSFLLVLCTAGTKSDDQLSFQPVAQRNPNAIRKAYVVSNFVTKFSALTCKNFIFLY